MSLLSGCAVFDRGNVVREIQQSWLSLVKGNINLTSRITENEGEQSFPFHHQASALIIEQQLVLQLF
jgi:hypothetical protein